MNFDLDDEQRLLEETLRRYFANDFSNTEVRAAFEAPALAVEQTPWSVLAEMGIFGMIVPEEHGGTGRRTPRRGGGRRVPRLTPRLLGRSSSTCSRRSPSSVGGSEQQQATLLPALAAGATRATLAVAEPAASWDPAELAIGGPELRGTKSWVLGAADADLAIVVLRDGLAVVPLGVDGVVVEPIQGLDAHATASPTSCWTLPSTSVCRAVSTLPAKCSTQPACCWPLTPSAAPSTASAPR